MGLIGDGEMGDLRASTTGDLSGRDGLAETAEMLRESLGFATREASMLPSWTSARYGLMCSV